MSKRNIIVVVVSVILIAILGVLLYFVLKEDEVKVGEEMTYQSYKILKGHEGALKDYDKTLYAEGYKGDYDEAYYITGKLVSNEEEKQDFVVIRFNLYDSKGKILGEAIAGINNVEKGVEYDFTAMSLTTTEAAKNVVSYELKSVESK
ncbi:MAG: FxLYD domain-containing protein [bacterium]|nr:FxLYD domain-containing protein [bacterium]